MPNLLTLDLTKIKNADLQTQLTAIQDAINSIYLGFGTINPDLNIATISSALPTGTVSATQVMLGLSSGVTTFTPLTSGRFLIFATCIAKNDTIGDGLTAVIKIGTGNGPANGAATTGTQVGLPKTFVGSTAVGRAGFSLTGLITGLVVGTPYYLDLSFAAVTGGTATLFDVVIVAIEG